MKYVGSALALTLFFALYGVVHSWLASLAVKNWMRRTFGPAADRWYRLAYNVFAVVTFLPMLALTAALPGKVLYVIDAPWRWLLVAGQLAALVGAGLTLLQTGAFHFLGLAQLVTDRPAENTPLNFRGMYRWVRHPLYFFSLMFLWLTPLMTTNSLVSYILFTLYFQFGSEYEERRMVAEYGAAYDAYRRTVPRLIPWPGRQYVAQEVPEN
jgi:protein-S-isoprenylcysteine O-methyltransferase Ste14